MNSPFISGRMSAILGSAILLRAFVALAVVAVLVMAAVLAGSVQVRADEENSNRDSSKDFSLASGNRDGKAIWSNGTTMWVVDGGGTIFAYKLSDGTRDSGKDFTTLAAAGNRHPSGLWSDGTTMWVSDSRDEHIYAYVLATKVRDSDKDISTPDNFNGNNETRGIWSDDTTMWAAQLAESNAWAYDLSDGTRKSNLDLSHTSFFMARNHYPCDIWSDGDTMWVLETVDDKIYAYRMADGERMPDLEFEDLDDNETPSGIWSDGTTMWVLDSEDDKVHAYTMPENATLKSLTVEDVSISFEQYETYYWSSVANSVSQTEVAAEAEFASSTIEITPADANATTTEHEVDLDTGDNTIKVKVTNGAAIKTYTVEVKRLTATTSDDARLSNLVLSDVDFGTFSSSKRLYTANVANSVSSVTVTPTVNQDDATYEITPADSDTNTTGHQVDLEGGSPNDIIIWVTASDRASKKKYRVRVNRSGSGAFGWTPDKDIKTSNTDGKPYGIWSDRTTMYVASNSDWVYAYSLASSTRDSDKDFQVATTNRKPADLWSDGTTIWVGQRRTNKHVHAYNLSNGARDSSKDFTRAQASVVGRAHGLWSNGTSTMWILDLRDAIYAFDLQTHQRQQEKDFGPPIYYLEANQLYNPALPLKPTALWSDGTTMWVTDAGWDKIFAYDLETRSRTPGKDFNTLHNAGNSRPNGLWSDGTTMYVSDAGDDKIYAYKMPE